MASWSSREEIEEVIGAMLDADYLSRVREKAL